MSRKARQAGLGQPNLHQIFDDREVLGVVGEKGGPVDIGSRSDCEIGGACPGVGATSCDRGLKSSPLARDPIIDRQGIGKARLDQAEARGPLRARLLLVRDEEAEVQLGDRYGADRGLDPRRRLPFDQDGGVEQEAQLLGSPGVAQIRAEPADVLPERGIGRERPEIGKLGAVHPLASPNGAELRDRPPGDGDRDLLTGLRPAQDLANLVAQLFLGDGRHA